MKRLMVVFAVMCAAGTALAATRYWNPTETKPESTGSSTMRYFWTTPANWLDEDGNTGIPQAGDDLVFAHGGGQTWGGTSPELHSVTIKSGSRQDCVNQTTMVFPGGSEGLLITGTASSYTWYSVIQLNGDGDVPFNIPDGVNLIFQKALRQGGSYSTGATLVKRGKGGMCLQDRSSWTSQCTYKKTRLEQGTLLFEFWGAGGKYGPKDFFPEGHDFMFAGNDSSARFSIAALDLRMKDVKFHEREDVGADHGITCYSTTNVYLRFTGTPQLESTVFSGKLYSSVGISWETADPAREFVFSNSVSTTTGGLLVSNGTIRITHGASFTALSNVYVAAGAKFKVDAGAGDSFYAKLLDVEDGTAEVNVGEGVFLSFRVAREGGEPVAAGVYTSADKAWIKGTGHVRVGDAPVVAPESAWWERADGPTVLAANAVTNYVGARLSGEALSFTAGAGARVYLGSGGFQTTGSGAAYTWGWDTCLDGAQTWDVASGDTLEITGELAGLGGSVVRKESAGMLRLKGAKSFHGNMIISNGLVEAVGDESLGGSGGKTTFVMTREGGVAGGAAKMGKLRIKLAEGASEVTFHRPIDFHYHYCDEYGDFLELPANATVHFYGLMQTIRDPHVSQYNYPCHWNYTCPSTTTVHWHGGMYASLNHKFPGGHHYVHKALTGGDRFSIWGGAVVELLAAGNRIGAATGNGYGNAIIYTRVPYALDSRSVNQLISFTGDGKLTIDLCGNDQALSIIYASVSNARYGQITSATPAFMHITGDQYVNSSSAGGFAHTCTNYVPWTGAAGLSMERTTTARPVVLMSESSTTGTLQVVSGKVVMHAPGGGWPNASAVVMKGGILEVEHSAAFGTNTVVRFAQKGGVYGKMNLFSGVRQKVAALEVDGVAQRAGLYGSSDSVAQYKRNDLFAGPGLLRVGEPIGLTVTIR